MNDNSRATDQTGVSLAARSARALLSLFAVLMCALALGAVVALLALFTGIRPCWWMLPGAVVLTWILRGTASLRGKLAPGIAAFAVLLAGAYAECLTAIARVAAITGASFSEAWHLGGAALTWQVAELGLSPLSVLVYAAAAIIAGWMATRNARP
ncbi:MAG TPA: hypothetical protein VFH71_09930 [Rhodanobacteraceae bacterium]|nr:hypothetical protein [Rhodanobacteraceae bacterium]